MFSYDSNEANRHRVTLSSRLKNQLPDLSIVFKLCIFRSIYCSLSAAKFKSLGTKSSSCYYFILTFYFASGSPLHIESPDVGIGPYSWANALPPRQTLDVGTRSGEATARKMHFPFCFCKDQPSPSHRHSKWLLMTLNSPNPNCSMTNQQGCWIIFYNVIVWILFHLFLSAFCLKRKGIQN